MSHVAIAGIVRTHIVDTLDGVGADWPLVHDNVPVGAVPPQGRWGRLTMQFGLREHADVGSFYVRIVGVALLQLFEPIGGGDGPQLEIVDVITAACDGITLPGPPSVAFQPPYISAPPIRDGAHWQTTVTIPFRGDIHHE